MCSGGTSVSVLEVHDVSIRYITGDFKDIGLKEYTMKKLKGDYHVTEFWADRNISFTLEKGEMLGIIGTNGAGKSTLLKAVSGIMEPTTGYVKREGKIAALLELASGFDGDLTVRENAYLRGAMLGYTRDFMDEKYDAIIDFAGLQDFQDRPFRQLSSGMKSRLAFSIASLVQPDLLILDEVLSVGDGAFRAKSEAKMREIIAGGAATILVSHSIGQVRSLCTRVLWLDHGKQIALSEDVENVCDLYQKFLNKEIGLGEVKRKVGDEKGGGKKGSGKCTKIFEDDIQGPVVGTTEGREADVQMGVVAEAYGKRTVLQCKNLPAAFKLAAKSACITGIIVHLYVFTNLILNHDSVVRAFYKNDNLALGRWALELFSSFSTKFQLPVVIALITLLALAISAGLTVEFLKIRNPLLITLTSVLLVSFPAVACTFSYMFTVDAYFIGLLLNTIGACVAKKYRHGWVLAVALLAVACGIYQAYLCYAIGLFLFDCILMLAAENSIKGVVRTGVKYVFTILFSLLIYYAVLNILLNIRHVTLSSYQGINEISLKSIGAFLARIPEAYKGFLKYFVAPPYLSGIAAFLCRGLFALLPVFVCSLIVVKKIYRDFPRLMLTIIGVLLIPLSLNFITVLVVNGSIHELMRYSFALQIVFTIKIAEELMTQLRGKSIKVGTLVFSVIMFLGISLSWNYFCVDNIAYLRCQICYENSFALANRVAARIEQEDGYSSEMPVAFVGEASRKLYGNTISRFSQYNSLTGTADVLLFSPEPNIRMRRFIEHYIGLRMRKPSQKQLQELSDAHIVETMPNYPSAGSITVYDDIIVVKLSDGEIR